MAHQGISDGLLGDHANRHRKKHNEGKVGFLQLQPPLPYLQDPVAGLAHARHVQMDYEAAGQNASTVHEMSWAQGNHVASHPKNSLLDAALRAKSRTALPCFNE